MMMKTLVLVLLVTILGCGSKGDSGAGSTTPAAPALASQCEATCKADGTTLESTREGKCVCARTAPAEVEGTSPEAQANRCTATGCAQACAPNTCVGWRPNASGGCNYGCLLTPAPVRW